MYQSSYEGGLRLPELGTRDRVIYLTLMAACVLSIVGATSAFLLFYEKVHFVSPEVIGFANRTGLLGWCAVCCIILLLELCPLIEGFNRKYPIFGAPGVTYGSPKWTQVYPLLMPRQDVPEEVRPGLRRARETVCFMLAGVVLVGVLFGVSLLSGNRLQEDGSVHVLWGFGWEVMDYQPEDVAEVTVSVKSTGRYDKKYKVFLDYKMDDDRLYQFCVREFRDDGETSPVALLVNVLRCYPEADIRFVNGGRIPDLVYDQQYDDKEERLLMELFSGR